MVNIKKEDVKKEDVKKDNEKALLEYAMFTDVDKIEKNTTVLNKPKEYNPSDEEIKIIIHQTSCSEQDAGKYLHKHKGDIEKTVFDILGLLDQTEVTVSDFIKDEDLLNDKIHTNDKMETYRDILYHKDLMYQDKFDITLSEFCFEDDDETSEVICMRCKQPPVSGWCLCDSCRRAIILGQGVQFELHVNNSK